MGTHAEAAHAKVPNSFLLNEPMVMAHVVGWILANVGALVVGRTHLVSAREWSGLAQGLTPVVTAVVAVGSAVIFRRFVSPAWKLLDAQAEHLGVHLAPPPDDIEGAFEDIDKLLEDIDKLQEYRHQSNALLPASVRDEIDASWQPPRASLVTASQVRQASARAPQQTFNTLPVVAAQGDEVVRESDPHEQTAVVLARTYPPAKRPWRSSALPSTG